MADGSGFEKQRISREKLIALIFVLWMPLPLIALGVYVWVGLSVPLMILVVIGTILSLGLALGAMRIRT